MWNPFAPRGNPFVGALCNGFVRKLAAVQITIDSTEPLEKVTAVVGALYGVELVVAAGSASAPTGRRGRSARVPAAAPTRSAARGRRRRGTHDPKAVRRWAVEQGLAVSSRGQLPKAVLTAYAESNG